MDLFDQGLQQHAYTPLADRMRPTSLDQVVGQDHLLGPGKLLRMAIEKDQLPSLILWGPPGSGKTTIAGLIAKYSGAQFKSYSAVTSGIKELKVVLQEAQNQLKYYQQKTLLFIDEIHRFNKAQQDAFLPYVEQGVVTLIGATTENPSFEVNAALLSRCQVLVLKALTSTSIQAILQRALPDASWLEQDILAFVAQKADGDARTALNYLELLLRHVEQNRDENKLDVSAAADLIQQKMLLYDKGGEEHFNLMSALHKSVRGSDPDAALYWLGRMLEAGEDPHYLLRRMMRMASEDIGLADPQALTMAVAARQAFDFIGLPEGKLALAQLAVYLSLAPKSNALETGYLAVQREINQYGALPVPMPIRNAPTKLMKNLGYGKGYRYAHDYDDHWVADDYLPDAIIDKRFYQPGDLGWESHFKQLINDRIIKKKEQRKNNK